MGAYMELKDRLKQARKVRKMTQAYVAEQSDITQATYSELERGLVKSTGKIISIAKALKVDAHWLATGEGESGLSEQQQGDGTLSNKIIKAWSQDDTPPAGMIPISYIQGVFADMGNGYVNSEPNDELMLWFREDTIRECNVNPDYAKVIAVRGDSMSPELTDGQVIAIDTSARRIYDGEIYAFRVGDELKVKYLFRHGDGFKAISRNEDKLRFPDEFYTAQDIENDNIEILGQFWWKSETRRVRR